jgi:hypothetical protein
MIDELNYCLTSSERYFSIEDTLTSHASVQIHFNSNRKTRKSIVSTQKTTRFQGNVTNITMFCTQVGRVIEL